MKNLPAFRKTLCHLQAVCWEGLRKVRSGVVGSRVWRFLGVVNRQMVYPLERRLDAIWQIYLGWRWQKTVSRTAGVFAAITISLMTYSAFAATSTATLIPNNNAASGWTAVPGGANYTTVDDGTTDNTSDYVEVLSSNSTAAVTDTYGLTTASSVSSASQITVRIYMEATTASNGGTMDTISLNLIVNGVAQTAATCTPTNGSWTACTHTFTGAWTQTDVDGMQVQIVRNIMGSGSPSKQPDTVLVSNVYGTLTYVPSIQFNQSAYRWFGNQDTANKLTFANSYSSGYNNSITKTTDGGYATVGCSSCGSMGSTLILTKYDSGGGISWSRQWNGYSMAEAGTVVQTKDGGFAIAGDTYNPGGGGYYMYLIKFDAAGNIIWTDIWGGSSYNDVAVAVAESSDGSLAVTGYTGSYGSGVGSTFDAFLTKFSSSGSMLWSKAFGAAAGDDYGWSVAATSDGGYALAGYGNSYTSAGNDVFLARFDKNGNLLWTRTWGGAYNDYLSSVSLTSDGGYALTGYTASYGTNPGAGFDAFLIKFDSTGNLKWSKTWGSASGDELAYGVVSTSDGGYALSGETASYGGGGRDAFLAKFSSTGSLEWSKTFGGSTDDIGYSLVQTSDGGYAMTGEVNGSNGFIAKFDGNGDIAGCGTLCTSPSVTLGSPTVTAVQPSAGTTAFTSTPSVNGSVTIFTVTKTVMVAASPANIDVGAALAAQDVAANAPDEGTIFRLRMNIHVSSAQADSGAMSVKLQYADRGAATSCSVVSSSRFNDVTDTTAGIRWADNANAGSGMSAKSNASDPLHGTDTNVDQSYQEKGTTTFSNPNAIPAGQDGMWDFGLVAYHSMQNTTYCFRIVKSDGSLLDSYTQYPELNIPPASFTQASYRWYNPEPSGAAETFVKAYGTSAADNAEAMVETSDGGYAATGYTNEGGNYDMLLAKYDGSGKLVWSKTWGGASSDYGYSLVQTSDGGYAVTGYTMSFGAGSNDTFLAKYDSSGNLSWSRTWGGTNDDFGKSIIQTSDGGYAITGYTGSFGAGGYDGFLLKFDSSGNLSWNKTFGGITDDAGYSLVQTSDGGYAVTGYSDSFGAGDVDMLIMKYDSSGNLVWGKTWGGSDYSHTPGLDTDYGYALIETSDGGLAVTGYTNSFGAGGDDLFLAKYDSSGNLSWSKAYGGSGFDYGLALKQTSDGGYAVTGYTNSFGAGANDLLLTKYDSSGNLSWSKTLGSSSDDQGYAIAQNSDGGYTVAGYTNSSGSGDYDLLMARYDSSGNINGCSSAMCQSVNLSTATPSAIDSSASPTIGTPAASSAKVGYSVGDTGPAGGIIFYVDSSNTFSGFDYLEAAPTDQGTSSWGCSGTVAGATWSGLGNGDQNTTTIVGACSGSTAAKMSDSLTSGGYSDWYLPDLEEVNMMISNISPSLSAGAYWSSSEDTYIDVPSRTGNYAYASSGDILKTTVANVRSARKFTGTEPGLGSYAMTTTVIVGSGVSVGNPLAPQDKPLDLPELTPLTLRVAVRTDGSGVATSGQSFKLQYAVKTSEATCSAVAATNYQDITSSSELAYYDDSRHASGEAIVDNPNDPSDGSRTMVAQAYEEANPFSNSVAPLYAGQDGMWQFSLVINNATLKGRDFCIRIALASDTYPSITALNVADVAYAPQMEQLMRGGEWFSRSTGAKQHISL